MVQSLKDQSLNFVSIDDESPKKKRRCVFLDDDDNDRSDEEAEDTDLEGFIDHDSIDAGDPSYHVVNQQLQQEETIHEVSCVEDGGIGYPLKVTKHECERHINILLAEEDGVHHYSLITDFSRLY